MTGGRLGAAASETNPQFKEFDEDFALQFSAVDVTFKFGTEIKVLDELESFDAVYIATGASGESFGLLESWDPELLTTSNPKVFMGGALCGAALIESIAQGLELSKTIEFFNDGQNLRHPRDLRKNDCGHYLTHDGEASVPLVNGFLRRRLYEEEAKAEAQRCFKCDCDYCEKSCEMLKWFKKKPHRIAVEVATDSQATSTLSARTITRETYSCNICGKCKSVCPENVDIGALLQFSRTDRLSAGKDIPAYHDYWLREMDFNSTEGYFAASEGRKSVLIRIFPGCQLARSTRTHTIKSFEY